MLNKIFIALSLIFQCVVIAGTVVIVQLSGLDSIPVAVTGSMIDWPNSTVCDPHQVTTLITLAQQANHATTDLLRVSYRVIEGVAWIIGGSLILQLILLYRLWQKRRDKKIDDAIS